MSSARHVSTACLAATALLAVACGDYGEEGTDPYDPPEFPANSGQPPPGVANCPKGPFGVGEGAIIDNYVFTGFPNSERDRDNPVTIGMCDFYNPTGEGVYAKEHPLFPDEPMPVALLVNIGAVWCGPCNEEAKSVLPPLYAKYQPRGGQFLFQLADTATQGEPATIETLQAWTAKYDVNYPATIDPNRKLAALFDASAYPANLVIDTRTMTIVATVSGAPPPGSTLWLKFEELLNQ